STTSRETASAPPNAGPTGTIQAAELASAPCSAHDADTAEAEVSSVDPAATDSIRAEVAGGREVTAASAVPTSASTDNYADADSAQAVGDPEVSPPVVPTVITASTSPPASAPEQAIVHPGSQDPAVEVAAALITTGRLGLAQHVLAQAG